MVKKQKKLVTLVNFILDKSGSMGSIQDSVISGFNEYIHGLKNKKGQFKFSLTIFDTDGIDKPYIDVDIKEVKELNKDTYRPNAGTPLYDAAVDTIEAVYEKVQNKKNYAVVTVIMTDGEENSSRRHDEKCLKDLIHKLEKTGSWTFAFMGANIDACSVAQKFGIGIGNTVSWLASDIGSKNAFRGLANATSDYGAYALSASAKGMSMKYDAFFDKEKDLIENGGDK